MASIKTRKFHLVEGPASRQLRETIENSDLALPPSYKAFVLRFGNAKLYRRKNYYLVEIYASPREAVGDACEPLFQFGRTHTSLAYFKQTLLMEGSESPVFEWRHERNLENSVDGFGQWLMAKCRAARRQYNNKEWKDIEKGPSPFSEKEKAIVEARKQFRWRVVGIAPSGDLKFEICNMRC